MKTAISTYSYSRLVKQSKMTIFEVIDKTKELGFDGIEFVDFTPPEGMTRVEFAGTLKKYCAEKELPIVNYAIGGNMLAPSLDDEVIRLCGQVDIAAALGSPSMRHDVAGGIPDTYTGVRTFDSVLPILAEGCRRVTEYAKTKGVKTCSENHGLFCQDSDRVVRLVEAVGNTNYGVLCDIGNFTCADDIPEIATGKVAPLAFHVHVKDMFVKNGQLPDPGRGGICSRGGNYLRCMILGHGDVPVMQCLRVLKKSGYDGYCSIEFEGIEDTMDGITIGLENLKKYIGMI